MEEIDTIEEVDFDNIPAPPNPNERIIYFNCPPLQIELGDVRFLKLFCLFVTSPFIIFVTLLLLFRLVIKLL